MGDPEVAQGPQQVHRAGQRAARWRESAEDLAMPPLEQLRFLAGQLPSDLSRHGAREEAATHADAAVDAPGVDGHSRFLERLLPSDDVLVDRVDQRPVEVEDESAHRASLRAGSATVTSYPGLMYLSANRSCVCSLFTPESAFQSRGS